MVEHHLMLEGRLDAYQRCLSTLLRCKWNAYDTYRKQQVDAFLEPTALKAEIQRTAKVLGERPVALSCAVRCRIGEPLTISNPSEYETPIRTRPLNYCFDPGRTKRDMFPWRGLELHGPFSTDTFARPAQRILVLHPEAAKGTAERFVQQLLDGIPPSNGFK